MSITIMFKIIRMSALMVQTDRLLFLQASEETSVVMMAVLAPRPPTHCARRGAKPLPDIIDGYFCNNLIS